MELSRKKVSAFFLQRKWAWLVLGGIGLGLFVLAQIPEPTHTLQSLLAKKHLPDLAAKLKQQAGTLPSVASIYVSTPSMPGTQESLRGQLATHLGIMHQPELKERILYTIVTQQRRYTTILTYYPYRAQPIAVWQTGKLFLWESLVVPLVAISLALIFKQVLLALGFAVALGALMVNAFAPLPALQTFGITYLWESISNPSHLYIYAFTTCLLCMVSVMVGSGGIAAFLNRLSLLAKSARATKLTAYLMGLIIFFDDYANTLVVGGSMRSFFKKARLSRAKLAYIVDSTSAPVAGLSLFSTWIVYEVSQLDATFGANHLSYNGFLTFLNAMGFRFYCWFTLVFVFFNLWMSREFGPMYVSDQAALKTVPTHPDADPDVTTHPPSSAWIAILPLLVILVGLPLALIWDGLKTPVNPHVSWGEWIRTVLGQANSSKILMWVSVSAWGIAVLSALLTRARTFGGVIQDSWKGVVSVGPALVILTLAWAIQSVCSDVQIATYLMALMGSNISPLWLAPVVFLIASAMSFSTGTSWGVMALMIPMVIPIAVAVGDNLTLWLATAAVLDGAIFGDHCSPISDTTIMSSIASSCDHVEHVNTQLPYAVTTMLVSLVTGYLPIAWGAPLWLSWILGIVAIGIILRWVGKPVIIPSSMDINPKRWWCWWYRSGRGAKQSGIGP